MMSGNPPRLILSHRLGISVRICHCGVTAAPCRSRRRALLIPVLHCCAEVREAEDMTLSATADIQLFRDIEGASALEQPDDWNCLRTTCQGQILACNREISVRIIIASCLFESIMVRIGSHLINGVVYKKHLINGCNDHEQHEHDE